MQIDATRATIWSVAATVLIVDDHVGTQVPARGLFALSGHTFQPAALLACWSAMDPEAIAGHVNEALEELAAR